MPGVPGSIPRRRWRLLESSFRFLSFPPSSQCDFLGELFEEKEREIVETNPCPSHALLSRRFPLLGCDGDPMCVLVFPAVFVLGCSSFSAQPCGRARPRPPIHLSRATLPSAFLLLRLAGSCALRPLYLLIRPLLSGNSPQTCGLCFLNEQPKSEGEAF